VFTGFMIGLACGSFLGKSFPKKNYMTFIQLLIGVFAALIGTTLFSSKMAEWNAWSIYFLYLAAILLIGGLTGFQFVQVSHKNAGSYAEISGKTYSYDLAGSALGALVVSIFMVPKLGIVTSVLIISFVNLGFGVWSFSKRINIQ
jgi:predicted membrane-bound spermidine synthase